MAIFTCLARYKSGLKMPKHVLGPSLYSVLTVLGVYKGTIELKMGRARDQASMSLKKKSKSMVMGHGRRMLFWADSRNKTEMVLPKEPSPLLIKYTGNHFFQAPSVLALKFNLLPHSISKYSSFIIFTKWAEGHALNLQPQEGSEKGLCPWTR